MAEYSLEQILSPQVILERISRIQLPGTSLSQLFGWNVGAGPVNGAMMKGNDAEGFGGGGGNTRDHAGRTGQYDIFDNTRRIATASVPGTASTIVEPQVVGQTLFTLPRVAESLPMPFEKLQNQRRVGGPASEYDQGGSSYIGFQQRFLAARAANVIELQTAGLLRGKYYLNVVGNVIHQTLTSSSRANEIVIDYQFPNDSSHVNQVGGRITAYWSVAGTDIPSNLHSINKYLIAETGQGFKHVIVPSAVALNIQQNTKVQTMAGNYEPLEYARRVGNGEFSFRLKGMPWWEFHVVDYILEQYKFSDDTYENVSVVPDNTVTFIPEVDESWTQYIRGGEEVVQGPNGARSFQYGFYSYAYPTHNPAGWMLNTIHNGLPALKVPKSIVHATVNGF